MGHKESVKVSIEELENKIVQRIPAFVRKILHKVRRVKDHAE